MMLRSQRGGGLNPARGSPGLTLARRALLATLLAPAALILLTIDAVPQQDPVHPALRRAAAMAAEGDSLFVWVFFEGRDLASAEQNAAFARAAQELSVRALERRARRGRIRGVVASDLPVTSNWIDQVEDTGLRLRRTSRWLNAISGVLDPDDLDAVAVLPFVREVRLLAIATRTDPRDDPDLPMGTSPPAAFDRPASGSQGGPPFDAAFYGNSWQQNLTLQVPELHEAGYTGAGVLIGIFDTGFDAGHEAFRQLVMDGRLIDQYDFVNDDPIVESEAGVDPASSHNHGTEVWSTIAAWWPGTLVGVAYDAEFLLARTEDVAVENQTEEDNWVVAMEWMEAQGVEVTNTSLGYLDWYSYRDLDGDSAVITMAADEAVARGVVVVTSAGNEGDLPRLADPDASPIQYYVTPPADGDSVIAVGATGYTGILASFSSHGPTFDGRIKPDVVAVGRSVYLATPSATDSSLKTANGTSYSSPLTAGVAALLLQAHPDWNPQTVLDALRYNADRSQNNTPGTADNDYGWGYVQGADAERDGPMPPPAENTLEFFNYPNPFRDETTFRIGVPDAGDGAIRVYTTAGSLVWMQRITASERGALSVPWNGKNASGRSVAAGVYLAVVDFEGRRATTTVLRIR